MSSKNHRLGNILVITGPSGVGKGTVVNELLKRVPNIKHSVSVTTRAMRAEEVEGVDYFFRSVEEFRHLESKQEFMESAEFAGSLYGTPKRWVLDQVDSGCDVIMEIEVQGAKQVRNKFGNSILIFLSPPSFEALAQRLSGRATESPEKLALRLNKAKQELEEKTLFDYEVVNDDLESAVNNLEHIVYAERFRINTKDQSAPIVSRD